LTKNSIISLQLLEIHVIPELARVEVTVVASAAKAFPTASLALQLEVPTALATSCVSGSPTMVESYKMYLEVAAAARIQYLEVPMASATLQIQFPMTSDTLDIARLLQIPHMAL
jgi:hypothetical protein